MYQRMLPSLKLALVKRILKGEPILKISLEANVSRTILYKWVTDFKRAKSNQKSKVFEKRASNKTRHWHRLPYNKEKKILKIALSNLTYSSAKIAEVSGCSSHGVWNVLVRFGLNTRQKRENYIKRYGESLVKCPSVDDKMVLIRRAEQGEKISRLCGEFKVSRTTFYKWARRYAQAGEDQKRQYLESFRPRAEKHWRYIPGLGDLILEIIQQTPQLALKEIYLRMQAKQGRKIGGVHGLYNFLVRRDLNTISKREQYARGFVYQPKVKTAPLYAPEIPLFKLRHLLAHFATVPKLVASDPKKGLPYAGAALSTFLLVFLWLRLLFTTPNASPFGLFFSSIALTFGLFFFIYSMKYYMTVLLVLRLAQGGGSNEPSKLETRLITALSKVPGFGGIAKAAERQGDSSAVNPLTLNLDKITLKSFPFVSIHVAIYNEKRVVERLIRACESQEYYEETIDNSPFDYAQGKQLTIDRENQQSTVNGQVSTVRLAAYELIIADDSTDETTEIVKQMLSLDGRILDRVRNDDEMEIYVSSPPVGSSLPVIKLIHRFSRSGFKGAALQKALENTNPKAMYISVFDADFVPYPDTIEQFVKTFQELNANVDANVNIQMDANISINSHESNSLTNSHSNIAAVQGYQWHVLNKSQTWITRGVRTEYAGSYVIERAGEEIYGGLKQIAGSVYAIRADILRQFGWGTSITEDFELTLRLYEAGYKVAFTPYIQAPAEAVSTIKRLVRQRMRWAEGASYNIKIMLPRLLFGRWEATPDNDTGSRLDESGHDPVSSGKVWRPSGLTRTEKLEFAYLAPYYLQAAFFVVGTFSWFISEAILGSRLPFWTAALGWSLVFTNILALPLMNIVGLFLEESDERDYIGILSFVALSYIVVPFQAYAAIKGFLETEEGPWFRTPKTGIVTDTFGRSGFSKFFGDLLGKKPGVAEMGRESWVSKGGWGMGIVKPALAFRPLQGNSFRIRPKQVRWFGNLALGFVIAVTVSMTIVAPLVPQSRIYAQKPVVKTIGDSSSADAEALTDKQKEQEGKVSTDEVKEEDSAVAGEEITKARLIGKTAKNGKKIEYVFSKEPVVRVKVEGPASAGASAGKYEIEFETKTIGGYDVRPKIARIYGEGQVVYEEAVEGVDIKYSLNGELITEEFILKNRKAAGAVGDKITQNIRTVGVKVVSPNPTAFGFYTEGNEELFKLSQPFAKDDDGLVSNDLSLSLEKPFDYPQGYRLTKTIGSAAQEWLKSPIRAYPVSIDPTIVTGGVDDSETTYGGLQRKLAYVSSNWYAFYNCDANPCTSTESKNKVYYQKSSNGTSWGGYVDMDSSDTDNFSPSISVSGNFIIVAWLDGSLDAIEIKSINTASSDALTGLCASADQGTIDTTTFMVTVAAVSTTEAVVAYSDTSSDTEVDIFDVTAITGGTCTPTYTDVSPGNITLGSGITAGDRPVVFALSSTKVGMVFQDGDLSYSELDIDADDWTTNNLIIAAVTDNIYSVTSDQAATPKIWILSANISDATDTNFYTCCTTDFATSTIDADVGAAGDDNVADVDMFCPSATNCKIVYIDDIDIAERKLIFVDCNNAACSSSTKTTLDPDYGDAGTSPGPSIFCVTDGDGVVSDNCKVVAGTLLDPFASPDLFFYDCVNDEDCSTNALGDIDIDVGDGTTILHTAIYCPADDDCKVVYNDAQSSDFDFVDCGDTTCDVIGNPGVSTVVTVDAGASAEPKSDISCATGAADCKLVYHDAGSSDFTFVDCTAAAACGTVSDIDGTVGATTGQVPSSIWCPAGDGTDCRVAFGAQDLNDFHIVDCGSTACSASNTITTLDGNGGADATNDPTISLDCISVSDCKAVYVGDLTASSQNLYIVDCDANACTTGSVIEIGASARYGAVIKCPATDDCKIAYYGGGSGGTPTLMFLDCDVTNCFPSVVDDTDPWQATGSDIETVSLTYRSDNASLYANIIQDASDQAYYKSTLVSSISWSGQTSWAFTAGALNEISSPERISAVAQMGVVVNRTDANGNFEFATVPENIIYLALLAPFLYRIFGRRKCRGRPVMRC